MNDTITALSKRLDAVESAREDAQNGTNGDIASLSARVDSEVDRLDPLIGDIQDTFAVMANLRQSQSASGLGDYIQMDEDEEGYIKIDMRSVRFFGALTIILVVCVPVLMVCLAMKCFGPGTVHKYAKVGVVSETEAE